MSGRGRKRLSPVFHASSTDRLPVGKGSPVAMSRTFDTDQGYEQDIRLSMWLKSMRDFLSAHYSDTRPSGFLRFPRLGER